MIVGFNNSYNNSFDNTLNNNGISNEELYKLMDSLSVEDSAAIIAGVSPSKVHYEYYDDYEHVHLKVNNSDPTNANEVFSICIKTLKHSIKTGKLRAYIETIKSTTNLVKADLNQDWLVLSDIDTKNTMIDRDDLKSWLDSRGVYPPLLFPNGKKDDYMNTNHANYSAKLAVCVRAWEVAQTAYIDDQTIKQFMENWIKENGSIYKLPKLNKTGIAELAAISNWDKSGTKIKGGIKSTVTLPSTVQKEVDTTYDTVHQKLKVNLPDTLPSDIDDNDIPF